jgi:beta-galactosidase
MYGTQRATQYGYSHFEFQVYGPANGPAIATQPASQTVNIGSTATFTVTAAGTRPFTYQWLLDGVAIPGATSASYSTPTVDATYNGNLYSVTVSSATGSVTSAAALLTLNGQAASTAPTITDRPRYS